MEKSAPVVGIGGVHAERSGKCGDGARHSHLIRALQVARAALHVFEDQVIEPPTGVLIERCFFGAHFF